MELSSFLLERFFGKFEFSVAHMLAASDCETFTIENILESDPQGARGFLQSKLGYTEPWGNPQLRQEIARLYQRQSADSVIVCSGAEEAIFLMMNALLKPGNQVIVHYPCYQSLGDIPRAIGCQVTYWPASPQKSWELDLAFLEKAITPRTRMVVINSPHNPTGYQMPQETLSELIEICRRNNLILFSDEVYRFLEYRDEERLPAVADVYASGISLGVMSKSFGLAGLRIGWLATDNRKWLDRISAYRDYTTICNSAPSEYLALQALRQKERIIARNVMIVQKNLAILKDFFDRFSDRVTWVQPQAGCVAFPWFRFHKIADDFYEKLAEEKGILLLPGNCFGFSSSFFRIGFGRKSFAAGLAHLAEFLGKNPFKEKANVKKNRME